MSHRSGPTALFFITNADHTYMHGHMADMKNTFQTGESFSAVRAGKWLASPCHSHPWPQYRRRTEQTLHSTCQCSAKVNQGGD